MLEIGVPLGNINFIKNSKTNLIWCIMFFHSFCFFKLFKKFHEILNLFYVVLLIVNVFECFD